MQALRSFESSKLTNLQWLDPRETLDDVSIQPRQVSRYLLAFSLVGTRSLYELHLFLTFRSSSILSVLGFVTRELASAYLD